MTPPFLRVYPPSEPEAGPAYWLPFLNKKLLIEGDEHHFALLQGDDEMRERLHPESVIYLGTLQGKACLTCEVHKDFTLPSGWQALSPYILLSRADEQTKLLVDYALQLLPWQHTGQFCPNCGHRTEASTGTWGRICPNCGYVSYPPVTPAILVLVHDGERFLLTHKPGWGKRYSCIAGFVEPGESLEECVQREVYEEVGLEVADVTYIGSQSWPFPHQLMVGFVARYVQGEIRLDQQELDDALWFRTDTLPELPPPHSLAHQIILSWISSRSP
jgi:NAD+ diphosphatase